MNKILLPFVFFLTLSGVLYAQHEVAFHIGQFFTFDEVQEYQNLDIVFPTNNALIKTKLELHYKYRVKDHFAIGASVPYIFVTNQDLSHTTKLSENPRSRQYITGKYEKQSTGLIINAELRPGFAKNFLCIHAGFGYLYHTINQINASLFSTTIDFTTVHEQRNVVLDLSNKSEYIFNIGAAFQSKIYKRIGLRYGTNYFYTPGVQVNNPILFPKIRRHCLNFEAGIIYYL